MVDFSLQCSRPQSGEFVIQPAGNVDVEHAAELASRGKAALSSDAAMHRLVIDLSRVTFMDSTGVGALIDIHVAATAVGVSLVIRDAPAVVTRILQITGLTPVFELQSSARPVGPSSIGDSA